MEGQYGVGSVGYSSSKCWELGDSAGGFGSGEC